MVVLDGTPIGRQDLIPLEASPFGLGLSLRKLSPLMRLHELHKKHSLLKVFKKKKKKGGGGGGEEAPATEASAASAASAEEAKAEGGAGPSKPPAVFLEVQGSSYLRWALIGGGVLVLGAAIFLILRKKKNR